VEWLICVLLLPQLQKRTDLLVQSSLAAHRAVHAAQEKEMCSKDCIAVSKKFPGARRAVKLLGAPAGSHAIPLHDDYIVRHH
jgi:hypothetical protein